MVHFLHCLHVCASETEVDLSQDESVRPTCNVCRCSEVGRCLRSLKSTQSSIILSNSLGSDPHIPDSIQEVNAAGCGTAMYEHHVNHVSFGFITCKLCFVS